MKQWIILVVSLLLSLIISEHFIRNFYPAPKVFRFLLGQKHSAYELSDNPILGYQLKANVRSEQPDCHNMFDYTNAFGQRDIERSIDRPAGKRRLIMLGDSVVAGHGLCQVNDTISRKLEELFPSQDVEVLNFGVGGYCTRAEIELLKVKGLQFNPDEVLLVFVNNDYINSNGAIINEIKSPRPALIEWAFRRSQLIRLIALQFNLFNFRDDLDPGTRLAQNSDFIGDDNIETGIGMLADLSASRQFTVRILLWPYFTDTGIEEPFPINQRSNDKLLKIEALADQYGMKSHRLSSFFKEHFAAILTAPRKGRHRRVTPRWTYTIGDGIHPSQIGAEVGSQAIFEILSQNPN